jgi:hypothetical protein
MAVAAMLVGGSSFGAKLMELTDQRGVGHVLLHAVKAWLYYLAIEPYVRRVWPRMLVGLVRVLSGRLRDPTVGREVLIGVATGCVLLAFLTIVLAVERRLVAPDAARLAPAASLRTILSPEHYLGNRAHVVAWAVMAGLSYAGIVVIVRLLLRGAIASAGVSLVLIAALEVGLYFRTDVSQWGALAYAIGIGVLLVWLYTRVGVLAAIAFFLVVRSLDLFMLEFDAWSTPYNVILLVSVIALAAYGFWVALAGRPIFPDILAEEQPAVPTG